jgi:hypothetical protein
MGAIPARYAVTVTSVDAGDGRWWPHVQIADDSGKVVKDADTASVRFATKEEASRVGWSFAEAWIGSRAA